MINIKKIQKGKDGQSSEIYNNVQLGSVYLESNPFCSNAKYFALPWDKPRGSILVHPISRVEALATDAPTVRDSEGGGYNCFDLSPFHDLLVAGAQDGKIYTFEIPEGGFTEETNQSSAKSVLEGHSARVLETVFHPTVENLLLSHCGGKQVKLWDLATSQEKLQLPSVHGGLITSVAFSYDGSQVATFCKDKKLRVFDPRSNSLVAEVDSHDGAKGGKVIWLGKHDRIATVGFSAGRSRDLFLYDSKKLGTALQKITIDRSATSTLMPFYDNDLNILFLAGKGDGNMRFYEYSSSSNTLDFLSEYKSSVPLSGLVKLPKQKLKFSASEIERVLKLTPKNIIPISFNIPKQYSGFDKELYPDTFDGKPVCSAEEWFSGVNKEPTLESLEQYAKN